LLGLRPDRLNDIHHRFFCIKMALVVVEPQSVAKIDLSSIGFM